ncbi:ribosomal RNA processing protein 1 homolog B [Suncus etruscus]|uniref:ribosomal RNA processing protein 1 homolog B n=1 Tax=Suncus etruscus TaxID=109475 RepID=UPI0021104AF1|nr:ribosomal RNA processing protein 1 homolog B [Suncus etruscus]
MQPAELQFAQRLASHEKGVRERAARRLRQYISAKTQREAGGFTQEELLKIWKGLFYCMWLQDEPLLQEELAVTMSQLIHVVDNSEAQHLFIQTFWQTMNREWKGIDRLRLNKYYMLIRLVLRQSFEVLKRNGWEKSRVQPLLNALTKEVLHPESQSPNGVRFHFIGIYLEELSKVGGKELLADQNLQLIDPFCKVAAETRDHTLVQTIARSVFEAIVHPSPSASEDPTAGASPLSGEEPWTVPGNGHPKTNGTAEDGDRAGGLEASGPLLQFNYKAVAARLLEMTSQKDTPPFNRKRLSRLAKKFQDLCEGEAMWSPVTACGSVAPPGQAQDLPVPGAEPALHGGRQPDAGEEQAQTAGGDAPGSNPPAAQEEPSRAPRKRRRKKRKNRAQHELGTGPEAPSSPQNATGPEAPAPPQDGAGQPRTGLGDAQKSCLGESPPTHVKRKRPRKKSLKSLGVHSGLPEDMSPCGPPQTQDTQVPRKKQKLRALPASGSGFSTMPQPGPTREPMDTSDVPSPALQGDGIQTPGPPGSGDSVTQKPTVPRNSSPLQSRKLKRKKGVPGPLGPHSPACPRPASLAKKKRVTGTLGSWPPAGAQRGQGPLTPSLGSSRRQPEPEKDFVQFSTSCLPKPLFCRKAKGSLATSAPCTPVQLSKTPSSTKKVTFGLSRNMTAEFRKTDRSILVSPTGPSRVAFNPEQRPLHGVLKSPRSPTSSTPTTKKLLLPTAQRRPRAMDFF